MDSITRIILYVFFGLTIGLLVGWGLLLRSYLVDERLIGQRFTELEKRVFTTEYRRVFIAYMNKQYTMPKDWDKNLPE